MAASAARKSAPSKKRKTTPPGQQSEPAKKKSPLYNLPQNYYAPSSIASMTRDELSEWRKEQRRKRNRESAAASRNKTRARIEELEGEVAKWKALYQDMETKMRCMERHVQFLTKFNGTSQDQPRTVAGGLASPPTVVSHPNSPPRSPPPPVVTSVPLPVPNAVTSFEAPLPAFPSHVAAHPFPSLLSEPQDCAQVEKQEAAADVAKSNEESRKHLISIPRQA